MSSTQPVFPNKFLRWFFLWPFILLWKTVTWTCNTIGILLSLILAIALMGTGYILATTIIGIIIGVPLMVFGLFLLARALY